MSVAVICLSLPSGHRLLRFSKRSVNKRKSRSKTNIGPEEKITKHLDRVPFEDGIRQLAKNVSVFYVQDAKTSSPYRAGGRAVRSKRNDRSDQNGLTA